MAAKERHKAKLLEYLGNPENDFLSRADLSTQVLGYKNPHSIHNTFNAPELNKIEAEALRIRRSKFAHRLAKTDDALLKKAEGGDVNAAKLVYQRFEDWSPKTTSEVTGPDGKPLNHPMARGELIQEIFDEINGATLGLPKPVHQPHER